MFAHLEDGVVLPFEVDGDNTASTTRKPTAAKVIPVVIRCVGFAIRLTLL